MNNSFWAMIRAAKGNKAGEGGEEEWAAERAP